MWYNKYTNIARLQVDEAIQPGLTSLNWMSLNIDKYLSCIDKALGKQTI